MGNQQTQQSQERRREREKQLERESKEKWEKWLEQQKLQDVKDEQERGKKNQEKELKLQELQRKRKIINSLRDELKNLKPGDSVEFPDGKIVYPEKLNVGLFGLTGIGKSSLLNSLKYALKGELTELMKEQTSPPDFQGGNTIRRLAVQMTKHLTFIDNKGVGPEDLEKIEAGKEIICQLEGRASFAEKVEWRKPSDKKNRPVDKDKRIYCTVLVFDARNAPSVYPVLKKLVTQIYDWQGRYPLGVLTHVDMATSDQLENMYVVLNAAGLADTYEVANITNTRHELDLDHQLNLLKLMKRCIKDGDRIFSLREEIEHLEMEEKIEGERRAEEERMEQVKKEREREEERRAHEAEEARIKKEKDDEMQKMVEERSKLRLQEDVEKKRVAREQKEKMLFYSMALLIVIILFMYYEWRVRNM